MLSRFRMSALLIAGVAGAIGAWLGSKHFFKSQSAVANEANPGVLPVAVAQQGYAAKFLETFKEYPPRQKADTFNLDEVMKTLEKSTQAK